MKISASILSADLLNLERDLKEAIDGGIDLIHLDVMDGHFVPNLTFGIPVGKSVRKRFDIPIESHLMISNPDRYIEEYSSFSEYVTIHWESAVQVSRVLQKIKEKGIKAGVAINPSTEVDSIEGILDRVDYVLVMTVNPGFSGQKMIKDALGKIDILRGIRGKQNLNFEIGVDGGINRDNIKEVITHGPDIIVSASAIFNGKIKENINFLRNAMSVSVNGSGNS